MTPEHFLFVTLRPFHHLKTRGSGEGEILSRPGYGTAKGLLPLRVIDGTASCKLFERCIFFWKITFSA